jgi:hypothetical protein
MEFSLYFINHFTDFIEIQFEKLALKFEAVAVSGLIISNKV